MDKLKQEFYHQLDLAKAELKLKNYSKSFYHLESAHILGQNHIARHTVSHLWMLYYGIKTKNVKEITGQILRILASLLFTLIWVPFGNTGGSNVSAIKPMPIRKELQKFFN
ncbi:DUF3703 domain-containing protein [Winogradskyella luteola]|nr:DUF3703 domain-containing protein [Winogradskyella luteola]